MARLTVTWRKSAIGYNKDQKDTIRKLGLRRLNQTVEIEDSPSARGMLHKVSHLVDIQEGSGS
ncbi:MAG TPA: 50S ribosomal protein L30 [Tepidiformaceae bacterium]|nr:50S ribosomal protein L30 [Tepidiformaceae bacterium]